jgi:hypothetical protein
MSTHRVLIDDRVMVPDAAFTHDGYRAWVASDSYPERIRTAYVRGEVLVEVSPEWAEAHNKVQLTLTLGIGSFVRTHDSGEVYADGVLLTNEAAGVSCQPDLTFVSSRSFEDAASACSRAQPVDTITSRFSAAPTSLWKSSATPL